MIKFQESPHSIKVTKKPMICENLSKGLIVQKKNASPQVHPT
jgi:hypothetical protein